VKPVTAPGGAPSSSWAAPDAARGPGAKSSTVEPADPAAGSRRGEGGADRGADLRAGLATVLGLVLLGAPVGLLWAAVAPKVSVSVSGSTVSFVDPDRSAFIAGDASFLALVFAAGLLTGALAWALGRRQGPAVVLALAAGGLLAAYVASRTGALLHESDARDALEAGRSGAVELGVRLRASEAIVGWPVGALLGFLVPSLARGE
jgi:hypothetical protein